MKAYRVIQASGNPDVLHEWGFGINGAHAPGGHQLPRPGKSFRATLSSGYDRLALAEEGIKMLGGGTIENFHEDVANGYTHTFSAKIQIRGKKREFTFHVIEL